MGVRWCALICIDPPSVTVSAAPIELWPHTEVLTLVSSSAQGPGSSQSCLLLAANWINFAYRKHSHAPWSYWSVHCIVSTFQGEGRGLFISHKICYQKLCSFHSQGRDLPWTQHWGYRALQRCANNIHTSGKWIKENHNYDPSLWWCIIYEQYLGYKLTQ